MPGDVIAPLFFAAFFALFLMLQRSVGFMIVWGNVVYERDQPRRFAAFRIAFALGIAACVAVAAWNAWNELIMPFFRAYFA